MDDTQGLEPAAGAPGGEEAQEGTTLSRRSFVGAGLAGAGVLLGAAAPAAAKSLATSTYNRHLGKRALSRGMAGGPTGFDGAERYQYGLNTPAGRAIAGLKRYTKNGQKRLDLRLRMWSGAQGQL